MNISLPTRVSLLTLTLAVALVLMAISPAGIAFYLVATPVLDVVQKSANFLVSACVALLNLLAIGAAFYAVSKASSRATSHPQSVWGRNANLFETARIVAIFLAVQVVVVFVASEIRSFVQIQVGNGIQVDMFTSTGRFVLFFALPIIGVCLLLFVAPVLSRLDGDGAATKGH